MLNIRLIITKLNFYYLFFIPVILCCNNLVQDVIERYPDGSYKYVKLYKKINSNEKLIMEKSYYSNQQLKELINYKDGIRQGSYITYYQNGQINLKANFENGLYHGEWFTYYKNGQIYYKENYNSGQKNGEFIWYFYNGNIESKMEFLDGKRHGQWIVYDSTSSKIKSIENYLNDCLNGEKITYYNNGQIHFKENYLMDERIEVFEYDKNGEKILKIK
tara:strand:+ start:131 stop:784 length:654 start_codon:yes stop_codon:yes gene_type:complete